MSTRFPHLFQPLTLRHKTLKHRLNFGAHTANMAEAGLPGERHLGYYRERAIGGRADQVPSVYQSPGARGRNAIRPFSGPWSRKGFAKPYQ